MKLSELLDGVANAAELSSERVDWCGSYGKAADTLRAIAPVLVEAFQIMGNHHQAHPHENCPSCRLFAAMKEAGVSCE